MTGSNVSAILYMRPFTLCWLTMITLYRLRFLSTSFGFNHAHKCISDGQRLNIVLQSCFAPERVTSSYSKDVNHRNAVKGHLNLKSFSTVTLNRLCWNCGSSAASFFCSSCNAIQPADDKTNYFDILNRWVNFLSLYIYCYSNECITYVVIVVYSLSSWFWTSKKLLSLFTFIPQNPYHCCHIMYCITLIQNCTDTDFGFRALDWISNVIVFQLHYSSHPDIYVTEHICLFLANKRFHWTPKNFRKDTWSCKDLSILTTSDRNHW